MFKLNAMQLAELRARDGEQFIAAMCDRFLESRPDMVERPGRDATLENMRQAFQFAIQAGFGSTPHVIRLMYFAADIPGVHDDPVVRAHLLRRGATPEQRLDDLLAVIDHKLKGMD
jgi:hypothetical protein